MFTIAICDEDMERCEQFKQMIQRHPENEELSVKTFCSEEEILADAWDAGNGYDLVVLGIQPNCADERKAEKLLQKLGDAARMAFLYISGGTNHMLLRLGDVIQANMQLVTNDSSYSLKKSIVYFELKADKLRVKPLMLDLPIMGRYSDQGVDKMKKDTGWCTYSIDMIRGYT